MKKIAAATFLVMPQGLEFIMSERQETTKRVLTIIGALAVLVAYPIFRFRHKLEFWTLSSRFSAEDLKRYEGLYDPAAIPVIAPSELPYRVGKVVVILPSRWSKYGSRVMGALFLTEIGVKASEVAEGRTLEHPAMLVPAWATLPIAIRASRPSEVETVVLADLRSVKVGDYVSKSTGNKMHDAFEQRGTLRFYNLRTGEFIGSYLLEGAPPKTEIGAFEASGTQDAPVADFLRRVPVR